MPTPASTNPHESDGSRFRRPRVPLGLFILHTSDGFADARLDGRQLACVDPQREVWFAVPDAGTPRWFRVREQRDDVIRSEDGTGAVHEYRLVPVDPATPWGYPSEAQSPSAAGDPPGGPVMREPND